MSEPLTGAAVAPLHPDELAAVIDLAVLATAGVARIEPSLVDAVRRIRRSILSGAGQGQPGQEQFGGVRLARRGDCVDVAVDIAVTGQALSTAAGVRDRVSAVLAEAGLVAGAVEVAVLAVHTETSTT